MSVLIDLIGAAVLVGMLMVTILNANLNMSNESFKSASEFHIQTEVIQLARIMEFDLYKMGYCVTKPGVISIAESSHVKFKANLENAFSGSSPVIDVVEYLLGTPNTVSVNPHDKHLLRVENITQGFISYSCTRFTLIYYNSRDSVIASPVTGSMLDSIRAIRVLLTAESPSPFDSTYASAYYEKLIYPRNLQ